MVRTIPPTAKFSARFSAPTARSRRSRIARSVSPRGARLPTGARRSGTLAHAPASDTTTAPPAIANVAASPTASERRPPTRSPTGTPSTIAARTVPAARPPCEAPPE